MNKLYTKILDLRYLPRFLKIGIIIGINWAFQSILYMDKTERNFKIVLDLIFFSGFFMIIKNYFPFPETILFSFITGHSCNWLFNGHLFGLLKTFEYGSIDPENFLAYVQDFKVRCSRQNSISEIWGFGSLARDELTNHSDFDVRIIRKKGMMNGIKSCFFVLFERTRALLSGFPLDIYLLDDSKKIGKMAETPIHL